MNGWNWQGWWNPWRRLRQMEREMNRMFGRALGSAPGPSGAVFPPVNVYTDREGAVVTAELPGVDPGDLDVSVRDRRLSLRGERKAPEAGQNDTWHRQERAFGPFARTVELPFAVDPDQVQATCRDGVLELRLQRSEADRPRKITVQG